MSEASTSTSEAVEMVDVSGEKEQSQTTSPDKSSNSLETASPLSSQSGGSTERKERQRYINKIYENIDLALKCLPEVSEGPAGATAAAELGATTAKKEEEEKVTEKEKTIDNEKKQESTKKDEGEECEKND